MLLDFQSVFKTLNKAEILNDNHAYTAWTIATIN